MTAARILLVEDDPVSREVIAALLTSRGHVIDTASDGFGALRLAQEHTFDLALVDYHLPEMDGYTLARLMRSLREGTNAKPKIVAITADRSGLAARHDVETVFDHVLTKPIEPDTLFTSIDEFLGRPAALPELETFATTEVDEGQIGAGETLWRVRGLPARPKALVFPFPTVVERKNLEHCFQIVDREPDCFVLLRAAGLSALEAARSAGAPSFQPLFVLDAALSSIADVYFQVGDGESWTRAAKAITSFSERRERLNTDVATSGEFDIRLAAYLYVADRPLVLARDAKGQTVVPYTGGFAPPAIAEAVRLLGARGLVSAQLEPSVAGFERRLIVNLSAKGLDFVTHVDTLRRVG